MRHVRDPETGALRNGHTVFAVYSEMFFQVARDYQSLGDVRTLTMREIRLFYEYLRPELRRMTAPPKK